MHFLVDETTGPAVAHWLADEGHEIFSVYESARGLEDEAIVQKAFVENWILLTNDKDFGEQVYHSHKPHHGVVLMRLNDERANSKSQVLDRLLSSYADRLQDQFVVVTERTVRFAKP